MSGTVFMARLSTTRCHTVGRFEIAFEIAPEASSLAGWLVSYFESETLNGTLFEAGQTVQLGWAVLLLRPAAEGLEVFEPDFKSLPIQWQAGVNSTIRQLFLQRSICDLFPCAPEFVSLMNAGFQVEDFPTSPDFSMSREAPDGAKSGWWFMPSEPSSNDVQLHSLYQLALTKPAIIPFLALPPGSAVRVQPGHIHVSMGGQALTSDSNELLHQLAQELRPRW